MYRFASFAFVCVVALACSACSSNNEGKIVGKWKATTPEGAAVIFDFTQDKKFIITAELGPIKKEVARGNYSLSMGDTVMLSDITPPLDGKSKSREKIAINGDTMTIDSDGGKKQTLTKVK